MTRRAYCCLSLRSTSRWAIASDRIFSVRWHVLPWILVAGCLAACGGGGSSGGSPQPVVSISSITPDNGPAGTEILVSGTGLDAVTATSVAATPSPFTIESAGRLRLIVPEGAASGRIQVTASGGVALSASNFTLSSGTPLPVAISLSSARIPWGGVITVSGVNLAQISQARLGTMVLSLLGRSTTSLDVGIPFATPSGFLTLVDSDGTARRSALFVEILEPMSVATVSRAVVARGQTLTLTGSNLNRATKVIFGGGAQAIVQSRAGSSSLSVQVPFTALDGTVVAHASSVDTAVSPSTVSVVDPILVIPVDYSVAAGGEFTVAGNGLDAVTSVTLDGSSALISTRSATVLALTVPAGIECARVVLQSESQNPVFAGTLVAGGACMIRAAGVDFAQLMSRPDTDDFLPMVPAKETWVRAYVVSDFPATMAPAMRAVGYLGGIPVGAVNLSGPAILPLLPSSSAPSASLREDDTATYNSQLPASWVENGLQVQIEIDSPQAGVPAKSVVSTPFMGSDTAIDLVLVPLVSGGYVPAMPALADVVDELARRLPVARDRIRISQRAAHTLGSVVNGVATPAQWSAALAELENIRVQEAPDKQYYAMVRPASVTGISGIGYVNPIASPAPSLSALGWDSTHGGWRRTLIHELGHNYSLWHAPCGNPGDTDPAFPYAGGLLGPIALFDSLTDRVIASLGHTDVMGYCNGSWFSDYNLREVKRFLDGQLQPAAGQTLTPASEVLIVSGVIDGNGARLSPVRSAHARVAAVRSGRNLLRLITRAGAVIDQPFDPAETDHAQGEMHFLVEISNPGDLASIEILGDGRRLALASARTAPLPGPGAGIQVAADGPWVSAAVRDGDLVVTWNAVASAYASLTLVHGGARQTLALNAAGGKFAIASAALPRGGRLEVSLSDGLNATLVSLPRP